MFVLLRGCTTLNVFSVREVGLMNLASLVAGLDAVSGCTQKGGMAEEKQKGHSVACTVFQWRSGVSRTTEEDSPQRRGVVEQ